MNTQLEMHVIVYGKVQGVGFRAMVLWLANQLSLKGKVWNLPDGGLGETVAGSSFQVELSL